MKNIISKYLPLLIFLLHFSCSEKKENCAEQKSNSLNPNGDSELAILMREMVNHAQSSKESILKKSELPQFPEHFSKIFFAKKTDVNIDKQLFDGLAQVYLNNLKYLYQSADSNRVQAYQSLVQSCSGCHQNFCSGPLKRINKLYLTE